MLAPFAAPTALVAWLVAGCAGPNPAEENIVESRLALNACDETVPVERAVDGFPAYAQCDAVESGNIWSNDGIDTSTSSLGDDWIQTQRGGGYQCTEWAYRYMHFRWGVDYRHGNAEEWCDGELPSTLVKATLPVHGDLIVFAGGTCGADETTGHIAVIDAVDATAAKVTLVEQNRAGRRNANQSCASCFLHAVANDGSPAGAGGAAAAGAAGIGGADNAQGGAPLQAGRGGFGGQAGATAAGAGGRSPAGGAGEPATAGASPSAATAGSGPEASGAGGRASSGGSGAGLEPAAGGMAPLGTGGRAGAPVAVAGESATSPSFEPPDADPAAGCALSARGQPANGALATALALLFGASRALRRRPRAARPVSV